MDSALIGQAEALSRKGALTPTVFYMEKTFEKISP